MHDQVFPYWNTYFGQEGWLIRPEIYGRYDIPKQKRLIELIRAQMNFGLFYLSCEELLDLIPDLMDIGSDIINPQVSVRGMHTIAMIKS